MKVLIGSVTLEEDVVMENRSFEYARSFERLSVKAGEYPIYAYENDLDKRNGRTELGWRNYIGFRGIVLNNSWDNGKGEESHYSVHCYNYTLAELFLKGFEYYPHTTIRMTYKLNKEWELKVHEFEWEGERKFSLRVVLKDGMEKTFME